MSNIKFRTPPISSLEEAQAQFTRLSPSLSDESAEVRVGYKTFLGRDNDAECFYIRHHSTRIVSYYFNGMITITNGGWFSPTTKTRLNYFSPISIWQKNYDWFFTTPEGETKEFFGRVMFLSTGKVLTDA